jgi:hydrogenase maturation protein HypF
MQRRRIIVQGIVQGVGFRPFVQCLATRLKLGGFVRNQAGSVRIEIEGESPSVDRFVDELAAGPPVLAQIDSISCEKLESCGEREFRIETSEADASCSVFVAPDVATCGDCLAELFDPTDRRYGHPFINCTNCGPRLTIITAAPFDRSRTTMASFKMCDACRAEYKNPDDRRFHAQAIACPHCGPRLALLDGAGNPMAGDPLAEFAAALADGRIGALKGLGGYHLVCDAGNEAVVAELRRRKHRDEKPFAVMVRDIATAETLCKLNASERALLQSPQCPIVLLNRRRNLTLNRRTSETALGNVVSGEVESRNVAHSVAPGCPLLGLMLPYTPVHHLLFKRWGERPLVMTSGNRADEPIACDREDALRRLAGIADVFLTHDRPIRVRCDDSVTRVVAGRELPVRRSRGDAPRPVRLPVECRAPVLAVGGQFKATFALGRDGQAFLSHHLGDLDHFAGYRAFQSDILLYEQLFDVRPEMIVHDLHPEYASTRYARERVTQSPDGSEATKLLAVQHHHAHIASCMAENGLLEPVIGVAFDGTGFGTDATIWGGEFLIADYRSFRRAAHLRPVAMPGAAQAIREPWRMAAAHLIDSNCGLNLFGSRIPTLELRAVATMIERRFHAPLTSSMGRLFDAVAAIAGVRNRVSFEGQAATQLEWLACDDEPGDPDGTYPFELGEQPVDRGSEPTLIIDVRPLIRAVVDDVRQLVAARRIARRFQSTVADLVTTVCRRLRKSTGLNAVALSGGVFMNALLTREVDGQLSRDGFRVYRHQLVPPNDGGLSLGQLAVAAAESQANWVLDGG